MVHNVMALFLKTMISIIPYLLNKAMFWHPQIFLAIIDALVPNQSARRCWTGKARKKHPALADKFKHNGLLCITVCYKDQLMSTCIINQWWAFGGRGWLGLVAAVVWYWNHPYLSKVSHILSFERQGSAGFQWSYLNSPIFPQHWQVVWFGKSYKKRECRVSGLAKSNDSFKIWLPHSDLSSSPSCFTCHNHSIKQQSGLWHSWTEQLARSGRTWAWATEVLGPSPCASPIS